MTAFVRHSQTLALIGLLAALLGGCTKDETRDEDTAEAVADVVRSDLYERCRNDPDCRGQKCVDVRGELYMRGDYKAAGLLDCTAGGLSSAKRNRKE